MAKSSARTVEEYLSGLTPERGEIVSGVREVVLANLPEGYEEGMLYGMISYHIPLARHPQTYNGQPLGLAALASQKNYVSLYMMGLYGSPGAEEWFRASFAERDKKLDMGKACVRFKRLDDIPLDVIGAAISRVSPEDLIERHEAAR